MSRSEPGDGLQQATRTRPRPGPIDRADWRFRRVLARIEPAVAAIVAEHATSFCGRPVRRREVAPRPDHPDRGVVWSIDTEVALELRFAERGPATLVVHDIGLLAPLRKAVRSRHVRIHHAAP